MRDRNYVAWPAAFFVDESELWFVHRSLNILLRYDLSRGNTQIVGPIPGELFRQGKGYSSIHKYGNKIILVPCFENGFAVYDIKKKEFKKIDIPGEISEGKYRMAYQEGEYLYCLPFKAASVLRINLCTFEMEKPINLLELARERYQKPDLWINGTTRINETLIAGVFAYKNILFIYDIQKNEVRFYEIGRNDCCYCDVASLGTKLFLSDKIAGTIWTWNLNEPEVQAKMELTLGGKYAVDAINDNYIVIDSMICKETYIVNKQCQIVYRDIKEDKDWFWTNYWASYCQGAVQKGKEEGYYFDTYESRVFSFTDKVNYSSERIRVSDKELKALRRKEDEAKMLKENLLWDLEELLLMEQVETERKQNACGKNIYDLVCGDGEVV